MLILDCSDGVRPLSTASFGCRSAHIQRCRFWLADCIFTPTDTDLHPNSIPDWQGNPPLRSRVSDTPKLAWV
jgi:hypothetical protein